MRRHQPIDGGPGEPALAPSTYESNDSCGPTQRVLVVEDNRDAADTLKELLECRGYQVRVAYSGLEGVDAALEFVPDVVVCDIGLPGIDGYDVARAVLREPPTASTRFIAVTGYGGESARHLSSEAGFEAHLTKPLDFETLDGLLQAGSALR